MFSSLVGNSSSVRAFGSKISSSYFGYPFAGTNQGFAAPSLAPNGLSYSVSRSRTNTTAPIQNSVILVLDPGKTNGRNSDGVLESWEPVKSYWVGDNYTNRPQFPLQSGTASDAQYNSKGILAPNGLLYFTCFTPYAPSTVGLPGLVVLNPGSGLVSCTGAQGTISGTTLTITVAPTSGSFGVGQTITGTGIPSNTTITRFDTGRGGAGTYVISNSATIAVAVSITGSPFPDCTWEFVSPFLNLRNGFDKYNGGVLAGDNKIYLTPTKSPQNFGNASKTCRIIPRSSATWINPDNPSTTTDIYEFGYYNASSVNRNLTYLNTTTPSTSSKIYYPIDENGIDVVPPFGVTLPNSAAVSSVFASAFYHPNGKIYYPSVGQFTFYHDINANSWTTNRQYVSKTSLGVPNTVSVTTANTFWSNAFEKPLDTVETTIVPSENRTTYTCEGAPYGEFNTTFTPTLIGTSENIPDTIQQSTDNATNYTTATWVNASNFGSGFDPWVFTKPSGINTLIQNPSVGGINTTNIGTTAFAIQSSNTAFGYFSRDLITPLEVGEGISFYIGINDNSGIDGSKGVYFKSGQSTVLAIVNGSSDNIVATGEAQSNTIDDQPGTNAMLIDVKRIQPTQYRLTITKRSTGTTSTFIYNSIKAIDNITFFVGAQSSTDNTKNLYFNDLQRYSFFKAGQYQQIDVEIGKTYTITSNTGYLYVMSSDLTRVYRKNPGTVGVSWNSTRNETVKVYLYSNSTCGLIAVPVTLQIQTEITQAFTVLDPTTIQFKIDLYNMNSAKVFQYMLLESDDGIFNGTPYVDSISVTNSVITVNVKNKEGSTPYNIANPPQIGSVIRAKQDLTRLKVYLYRTLTPGTIVPAPGLSNYGILVFDPVTESISHVTGTSNISGTTAGTYSFNISLPNGRNLRLGSGNYSNNILTGTDARFLSSASTIKQSTAINVMPNNGIPGLGSNSNFPDLSTNTQVAGTIPNFGDTLGKTFGMSTEAPNGAGEIVSLKGYVPGVRYFSVPSEDENYYKIPKTPSGDFDADNFANSLYNIMFNRPC